MSLSAEQIQLNRNSASNVVKASLNLQDKANADWTYDERVSYNKALANYIASNPSLFATDDLITAKDVQNTDYGMLTDYSVGDAFSDFGSEVGNQIVSLNSNLNPFSEQNRKYVLWIVVAGAAIYFLAPVIIKALNEKQTAKAA